jgi:hypothetical protein
MGKHLSWWLMERVQYWEVNEETFCLVANGRNSMFGGQLGGIVLDGQWKESNAWRSMGKHFFGGHWKVPSLVAFIKRRKNIIFTSFHFPLQQILFKHFFY